MRRALIKCAEPVKWLCQRRTFRPTIRISQERFEVTIDVRHFHIDEIRVKARPDYVVIEGRQERRLKNGIITRQFLRRFRLPEGCIPENMDSKLSDEGLLTISACRKVCPSAHCETMVPISYAGPNKKDSSFLRFDDWCRPCDPCATYLKIHREIKPSREFKPPCEIKPSGKGNPSDGEKPK